MLMAPGVPRETIMADYLLSNENQISAKNWAPVR
ncbi:MAG: tyrosine-protein phosphatase [Peptococcaceae bacterium]|nr:tyrosine-protein phosphatase [Peptococcaceae bacterium]